MSAKEMNSRNKQRPRIMTGDVEEEAAPSADRIEERARELAVLVGRTPEEVTEDDRRRARSELSGRDFELNENEPSVATRAARDPSEPIIDEQHRQTERHPPDEAMTSEELAKEGNREAEHEKLVQGQDQYNDSGEHPDHNI